MMRKVCSSWLLASMAWMGVASAAEQGVSTSGWPQFRGANRDGASVEKGLLRRWPDGGPQVLWRRPLGEGFAGIAVASGRAFTMFAEGDEELLIALDAATGKELWRVPVGERFKDEFGDGPRSTPTLDGDRVLALSSKGQLHALQAIDGTRVWQVDLTKLGGAVPRWGYSTSPLIEKDIVLLEVGGGEGKAFYALDKRTGETRWSALDGGAGYSSPIAATIHGVRQFIFVGGAEIFALRNDGQLHWKHPWAAGAIAMPLYFAPDRIFVSSAADVGSVMLQMSEVGEGRAVVKELWQSRFMKNHFNSSVASGNYIYGFDNATLRCISAESGEDVWAKRLLGKGSLILADGLLIALGDRGQLVLAEATPAGYEERGRMQVFDDKTWTSPTLAGGKLFLRGQKELVCIGVAG